MTSLSTDLSWIKSWYSCMPPPQITQHYTSPSSTTDLCSCHHVLQSSSFPYITKQRCLSPFLMLFVSLLTVVMFFHLAVSRQLLFDALQDKHSQNTQMFAAVVECGHLTQNVDCWLVENFLGDWVWTLKSPIHQHSGHLHPEKRLAAIGRSVETPSHQELWCRALLSHSRSDIIGGEGGAPLVIETTR